MHIELLVLALLLSFAAATRFVQPLRSGHRLMVDVRRGAANVAERHDVVVGRVSFALGLQGPCVSVDTACASALSAYVRSSSAQTLGGSREVRGDRLRVAGRAARAANT